MFFFFRTHCLEIFIIINEGRKQVKLLITKDEYEAIQSEYLFYHKPKYRLPRKPFSQYMKLSKLILESFKEETDETFTGKVRVNKYLITIDED